MPSAKGINQIKTNLLRPALTSHFEVEIPLPNNEGFPSFLSDNLNSSFDQQRLNLMCSEAVLPGSSLATLELDNDHTGVTERHVHRRVYDDRIDLTFYVNVDNYLPIIFFESWIKYISAEQITGGDRGVGVKSKNYFYRMRYPDDYIADQGLIVRKFERDYKSRLTYEFIRSFPISITSMPVSYDTSSLLKCTVSMSYIRYFVKEMKADISQPKPNTPDNQAKYNSSAFDPFSAGTGDNGESTVYTPFGSQTTLYEPGQRVTIGGKTYTSEGSLDF